MSIEVSDDTQPFDIVNLSSDYAQPTDVAQPTDAGQPSAPDGQMNGQEMPTADGQMASNTSEEIIPPAA